MLPSVQICEVFFGLTLGIQNAILLTIVTMLVVIYWLDLYYRNALSGGLLRSIFLEMFSLEGGLTYNISSIYSKTKSEYFIVILYSGLFATAIFVAAALNNPEQLLSKTSGNMAANATNTAANATNTATNPAAITANSSNTLANSWDPFFNFLSNAKVIFSGDFSNILNNLALNFRQPFVLTILIVGIAFIYTMYLFSRKRRRTFSQTMKVYDYCVTLAHESGRLNLNKDIQRVVMKIFQEKEKERHTFSLPIGRVRFRAEFQSPTKTYDIKRGHKGTLFLAERKTGQDVSSKDKPDHYWLLISNIGILMLNTIGTLDRPQFKPDVFHFAWYGEEEPNLEDKLDERKIIEDHCLIIAKIYSLYKMESTS